MSRHLLVDSPNLQVVLGFDHMLHSFFGQVFRPADCHSQDNAVAGWPSASGLGTRRPARLCAEREADLRLLVGWAREQLPADVWEDPDASGHLARLRSTLRFEWADGLDYPEMSVPAVLREAC